MKHTLSQWWTPYERMALIAAYADIAATLDAPALPGVLDIAFGSTDELEAYRPQLQHCLDRTLAELDTELTLELMIVRMWTGRILWGKFRGRRLVVGRDVASVSETANFGERDK